MRNLLFSWTYFSEEVPPLENSLKDDALSYLKIGIKLYTHAESHGGSNFLDGHLGTILGAGFSGSMSITSGNIRIVTGENGNLSINGIQQKAHIDSISDLEYALKNKHWFTIKNCLADIAMSAQRILVLSERGQNIEHAKAQATGRLVPSGLRTKLLAVIGENSNPDITAWLLQQQDFEGSWCSPLLDRTT